MAADNDWPMVVRNLRWAWKKWDQMTHLLGREGADARMSGMFYVVVVQIFLLYGLETWVMYPCIGRTLHVFHHRVEEATVEGTGLDVGVTPSGRGDGGGGPTGGGYLRLSPP